MLVTFAGRSPAPRWFGRSLVMAALLSAAVPEATFAAELEAGRVYDGGTRLEASSEGLTLTVPEGWQALLPQGAEATSAEARAPQATALPHLASRSAAADEALTIDGLPIRAAQPPRPRPSLPNNLPLMIDPVTIMVLKAAAVE